MREKRSWPLGRRPGSFPFAVRRYRRASLAVPEILDVDVGAEPYVIRKIPTVVIRILIDHDLIGIPKPVTAEAEIVWGDVKKEAAEPEAARASPTNPPDVTATQASGKPSVCPWMIHMIVDVIASRVVADPLIVLDVNVGSTGMAGLLAMALNRRRRVRWGLIRSGTVSGNMPAANLGFGLLLRESRS